MLPTNEEMLLAASEGAAATEDLSKPGCVQKGAHHITASICTLTVSACGLQLHAAGAGCLVGKLSGVCRMLRGPISTKCSGVLTFARKSWQDGQRAFSKPARTRC